MNTTAVNQIELRADTIAQLTNATPHLTSRPLLDDVAEVTDGVLSEQEAALLLADLDTHQWQPVGLDGIAAHYSDGDRVGSWRATIDSEALAAELWRRMEGHFGGVTDFTGRTDSDHDGHGRWRAMGINSRLRCIRYLQGGLLVPHYDAPFHYGDGQRRTLKTVVLYLGCTGEVTGGATRFLTDPQAQLPVADKDLSDWRRLARPDEVLARVTAAPGRVLTFNHRLLHDSEPLEGDGSKTIIRTDIVFEQA